MRQRLTEIKKAIFPWPALTILILFILDQATKVWTVLQNKRNGTISYVIPDWFHLVDFRNPGAAWGIFREHTWILALVSLFAFLYLLYDFPVLVQKSKFRCVMLTLLMGGIIGNWWDRQFREGGVVDMLQVYIPTPKFIRDLCNEAYFHPTTGRYSFPAFNVADACICIATVLFIYYTLSHAEQELIEKKTTEEEPTHDQTDLKDNA